MKKIPTLFHRDFNASAKVYDEIVTGVEWVRDGEGIATRKWDGVAVLVRGGKPYKRYDAKPGRKPPANFEPIQPEPDPVSGHWPGWVPADGPESVYIREGLAWGVKNRYIDGVPDGTYEVCGPRIGTRHGANPEKLDEHILIPHGEDVLDDCPRDYAGLMEYLKDKAIEGVVWHHPDGRMAKIKKADFPY